MEADTPEDQLIFNAKVGNCWKIQSLLQLRVQQSISLNINCKCKSKYSLIPVGSKRMSHLCSAGSKDAPGWTPLHLACYCGHKDVVEELLKVRQGSWGGPATLLGRIDGLMAFPAGWSWC